MPARGLTAVVGPSGAGKTTMFQLIERFYPVDGGSVLLSGRNIEALPLDTVSGLVGYVQQDSAAMRGTVRENLTYAHPHAGDDAIREAVEMAGLSPEDRHIEPVLVSMAFPQEGDVTPAEAPSRLAA